MSIAFSCPQCGKGYKVKVELAGKSVTCKYCSAPIRVPFPVAAPAMPSPEAELVAKAALSEAAHAANAGRISRGGGTTDDIILAGAHES